MIIYLVFKNADMTKGRGPMIFDSAWLDVYKAIGYIDGKPGVMGIKRKWSEEEYGDWMIRPTKVSDQE